MFWIFVRIASLRGFKKKYPEHMLLEVFNAMFLHNF